MLKTISKVITTLFLIAVFASIGSLIYIKQIQHGNATTILTGSMEPTISPGDIVITIPFKDKNDIKKNDIIAFMPYSNNPTTFIHRVVEIDKENKTFTTKGDANGAKDQPIVYEQIRGKVILTIPYLGYPINFIQNNVRIVIIIISLIVIILILKSLILPKKDILRNDKIGKNDEKE